MNKVFKVPKTYSDLYDRAGYFGLLTERNRGLLWFHCRESFHQTHYPCAAKIFLFKVHNDSLQTEKFIRHAEKILGIGRKYRCQFLKTDDLKTLAIRPGLFWGVKKRILLLTILLRASQEYNVARKNFWQACKKEEYLENTWVAFKQFMKGNTEIVVCKSRPMSDFYHDPYYYHFNGWVEEFSHRTQKSLVEPKKWEASLVPTKSDKIRQSIKKRYQ